MLKSILTTKQEDLLKQERQWLAELQVILSKLGVASEDQTTLARSIQQLDELFLLVVVGEFNSGKSAFINALLGRPVLKEGVTPTTAQINLLKFGETSQRQAQDAHLHLLTEPLDLLRQISIVDTPGTNAIIKEHQAITEEFVPRSDLVLFITSADRPFTESERLFLEKIRDWGKKVVVVINKIDILQSEADLNQVQDFIVENSRSLLGITPEVFPVSSRMAQRAKLGESEEWIESRFEPLEQYIHDSLDESSRLRLKFSNPLGVGAHLLEKYLQISQSRLGLLKSDTDMLSDVDSQLGIYKEDMNRNFNFRMSDIENILYEMEQRGHEYFDETFRLARVFDLLSKERIRGEFEHRVVADAPQRIERKVNELIDWLVDSDLRQWQAVNEHLAERRRAHQERIVGDAGMAGFSYDRDRLMEAVGREARRVVDTYNKVEEARAIAEGAQTAVAASAALEISAVGLGTLVTIIATTAAADVTGILMAGAIAALGLFIIPARRRAAKAEMKQKVSDLREQLAQALRAQFEHEIERSLQQIQEAIAPYTRFVRSERNKLSEAQSSLEEMKTELENLKVRIEDIT